MLSGSEKYYDDIYSATGKDYAAEASKVHAFIQKHKRTDGNTLLDVACGTGTHLGSLCEHYQVDKPDIKIIRMALAGKRGKVSLLEFQYLIGTSNGIEHIAEHHEFGLFSQAEDMEAFTRAGFYVTHNPQGLFGRGLYIGVNPLELQ